MSIVSCPLSILNRMELGAFAEQFDKYVRSLEGLAVDEVHKYPKDAVAFVKEQLNSGMTGADEMLKPTYLTDPYFDEEGPWKGRAKQYMKFKERITPPETGQRLFLPPRPVDIPNLRITGVFYDSIYARPTKAGLRIGTDSVSLGGSIEEKYGSDIFRLGFRASEWMLTKVVERWEKEGPF